MGKMEEFFKKAAEDENIKEELKAILSGKKPEELTEEDLKKVVVLAKQHGFALEKTGELSDDDLENVSGGTSSFSEETGISEETIERLESTVSPLLGYFWGAIFG